MLFWLMALSYKLSWDSEGFFGDLLWEMPDQVGNDKAGTVGHDGKEGQERRMTRYQKALVGNSSINTYLWKDIPIII